MDHTKIANRVSAVTVIANLMLCIFKLVTGIIACSSAMISDAVHSASDVLSAFAVIAGINISARAEDRGHQYGHERIEAVFAIILVVFLFATGIWIGCSGISKIISGDYSSIEMPGRLALIAAAISVAAKEAMYRYTIINAKKIRSAALEAAAWDHRSDALSSIGSFAGILGARLGFPVCDPIASVVICLFILKAAIDIFKNAVDQLIDTACGDETERLIEKTVRSVGGVISVDDLKTRLFGAKIYVDVEIGADGSMTLYEAHEIAKNVHDKIESGFPEVKHCMVHVNPVQIQQTAVDTDI